MALLLLACLMVPPTPPSPPPLVASMERFACYGRCPVYTLRVFEDGGLLYHGTRFVKVEGDVQSTLTAEQFQELSLLFTENGYFSLHDQTAVDVTDAPSVRLYFRTAERENTLLHYLGDQSSPAELWLIEDGFDRVVGAEQWVGGASR